MKYIKHIRWDFLSNTWVMPQGWHFKCLGVLGGGGGSKIKFSEYSHVAYQIKKG